MPNKLSLSIGLTPFSIVDFNNTTVKNILDVNGSPVDETSELNVIGSGGLNQFSLGGGYQIDSGLYVGAKLTYLFGTITNESDFIIRNVDGTNLGIFESVLFNRESYQGFAAQFGLAYQRPIGNNLQLNFGATYDIPTNASVGQINTLELRTVADDFVALDTLLDNSNLSTRIPGAFGIGFSIEKPFNWLAGIDFSFRDWSNFEATEGPSENLNTSFKIVAGGEYTPNFNALQGYFKRVTYRLGVNYEQTPLVVNNEQFRDIGINFGLSLPVRFSSLNLGVALETEEVQVII